MTSKIAKLTDSQLEEIRKLEKRMKDIVLVAYEKPTDPARLTTQQLEKIRSLEKELGVILVAYRQDKLNSLSL